MNNNKLNLIIESYFNGQFTQFFTQVTRYGKYKAMKHILKYDIDDSTKIEILKKIIGA